MPLYLRTVEHLKKNWRWSREYYGYHYSFYTIAYRYCYYDGYYSSNSNFGETITVMHNNSWNGRIAITVATIAVTSVALFITAITMAIKNLGSGSDYGDDCYWFSFNKQQLKWLL